MKTYHLLFVILIASLVSCTNNTSTSSSEDLATDTVEDTSASEGYTLMQEKCYTCHFEKPNPAKKGTMIAPPMQRVQEHYKPAHDSKESFVADVIAYINNPSEETTRMPGAVRKFNLMPKVTYDEAELVFIVEALYDMDFGSSNKPMSKRVLTLNEGEKWVLNKESKQLISSINEQLNSFESDQVSAYNSLAQDVFDKSKRILLDDSYSEEKFDQLHAFFSGIESSMHEMMATTSLDEAKNHLKDLQSKFSEFKTYFN